MWLSMAFVQSFLKIYNHLCSYISVAKAWSNEMFIITYHTSNFLMVNNFSVHAG